MSFIHTESDLDAALTQLTAADPRLAALLQVAGRPPLRRRSGGFEGLASIVVSQQLSVASAAAVWGRLSAALDPFHHATMRRARTRTLQRAGLSAAKIRTLKAVAKAIDTGAIDLDALAAIEADQAHALLTTLHGIGPWTADIYLLSCLGHADAWPAGDLALQEAVRLAFALEARPTTKEMGPLAEAWRPWRGVAARLLWTYYRSVKRREGAPIQPTASAVPSLPQHKRVDARLGRAKRGRVREAVRR
jgi:DNA-3-methyladenine glycosylase II